MATIVPRRLILHLSDLHFGEFGRFKHIDPAVVARRCFRAVEEERARLKISEQVSLVIVTGDIAERGIAPEYERAAAFFTALVGHLGVPRHRFIFVPGNHDVSWHKCRILQEQRDGGDITQAEYEQQLHRVKLEPYEKFVSAVLGEAREKGGAVQLRSHHAWVHSFPELGIDVAALNSCELETPSTHVGMLSEAQAEALMDHWGASTAERMRIVAVHHNPIATVPTGVAEWKKWAIEKGAIDKGMIDRAISDLVGFDGRERLQRIANDCQVQFVLHGHHHASSADTAWNWRTGTMAGQTHVLSAGSWGLAPERVPGDEPAAMQLLLVDYGAAELHPLLLRYEPRAAILGEIESGAFVADLTGRHAPLRLTLPPALRLEPGAAKLPSDTTIAGQMAEFLTIVRQHYRGRYIRLDLRGIGAVQGGGSGAPVAPALDEVYVPLRFSNASTRLPGEETASVLDPTALLRRLHAPQKRPKGRQKIKGKKKNRQGPSESTRGLVLVGPAGAGKTTWMRWTFRRLVDRPDVVPFLIELREFARHCDDANVAYDRKNIQGFLDHLVEELGVQGWKKSVEELFTSERAPRPILLVDGWDELGDLGERTREQLVAFLITHPRVTAVVTSRPYGQSRPAAVEGFDELYLRPLTDDDINALARNFHKAVHLHRDQGDTVIVAIEKFEEALRDSPDAKGLARTPLLLTMMLFISRDRPLPDRRHRLYDSCLDTMLAARPEMKRQEGARLASTQWCPDDTVERRRATANMASAIQERRDIRTAEGERVAIVVERAIAERSLPENGVRHSAAGSLSG
ncbi:MAG: metallophosphoesterase [Minicystis sp.]